MKIYKFGGTSIGSANRMKNVAKLITNEENKIVVLSAMAGTTNALVKTTELLYENRNDEATEIVNELELKYKKVVQELFTEENYEKLGGENIQSHFDHIRSFIKDVFTVHEEKEILAQGELISSTLFHLYLKEQNIECILLPALNFMRVDANGNRIVSI